MKLSFLPASALAGLVAIVSASVFLVGGSVNVTTAQGQPPPVPAIRVQPLKVFDGKSLTGLRTLGPAEWKAEGGTISGTSRSGGGWLVIDTVYGNAAVEVQFECEANCEPGVMVRSSQRADRTSGVYLPLSGQGANGTLFRVDLDALGKEVDRKEMPKYTRQVVSEGPNYLVTGGCPPVPCLGIKDAHGGGAGSPGSIAAQVQFGLKPGALNTLTVSIANETITGNFNGSRLPNTVMDDGAYHGKVAVRIGGPDGAAIRIKRLAVRDYTTRVAGVMPEYTDPNFKKVYLTDVFYAEGAAVGDLNRDGKQDVVAGPLYYLGPDFLEAHEIYPPASINIGGSEYPGGPPVSQVGAITHGNYPPSFMSWVYDFNGDGWQDVFMIMSFGPRPTFSGHLFVNPKGETRHWDNYQVIPLITNEANQFVDINGDGKPDVSMQLATRSDWSDAQIGYATANFADPTELWTFTAVSEKGKWSGHGLATGDVNADGRLDFVSPVGWWEQPPKGTPGFWKYHEARFGNGGADIYVYDVNGDKRPDIITSLAAHGPGLAWFEQKADGTFDQHMIMDAPANRKSPNELAFTELHALTIGDIDGDGLKDIITGKRWWSHGYRYDDENDLTDPAVIYWFKLTRKAGGQVEFVPHLINNYSGVGVQLITGDVDGDGKLDVIQSARKGTAVFLNRMR